jgi:hypothetical protein
MVVFVFCFFACICFFFVFCLWRMALFWATGVRFLEFTRLWSGSGWVAVGGMCFWGHGDHFEW